MVSFSDVLKFTTGELFWKSTPVGSLETGFEMLYIRVPMYVRGKTVTKLYLQRNVKN